MVYRTASVSAMFRKANRPDTYKLGFCLGLEKMRLSEHVGVADTRLANWSTRVPFTSHCRVAHCLLVELLLLAAPDNHELLKTLLLPLIKLLCLEFQLLLLLLVDVSTTALGGTRRALGEGAKQRAKQTLSALALLHSTSPAAIGAAVGRRVILVAWAVLGVIVGVVYAQARALDTGFGDGRLPALLGGFAG